MAQVVTPYLLYADVEDAAEFLVRAFGFTEVDRHIGGAGGLHLEFETDLGGRIYAGQPPRGFRNPDDAGRTSLLYVLVADVDAHHNRAKAAGATIVEELVDTPAGHRRYTCRDAQGHAWAFAQAISSPT